MGDRDVLREIRDLLREINERGKRHETFSREQAAKLDAELEADCPRGEATE